MVRLGKFSSAKGREPAIVGIYAAHDALVLAIGSWIQQRRNRKGKTVDDIAGKISQNVNRFADVSAIENGDWRFDEDFITAVLHQVGIKNPEELAQTMKKLEEVGREIKEYLR